MTVLLTRPDGENARIAAMLAPLGAASLEWPLTRIIALVRRLQVPAGTDAILFTSANAVRAFAAASPERRLPVLCVGDRTAAVARAEGFGAVESAAGDAADLVRLARAGGWRRLFHPRGREARDLDLYIGGADQAPHVEALAVYAAEPAGPPPPAVADAFVSGAIDIVTIWSPRNAAILRDWLVAVRPPIGQTALLGISEAAIGPARGLGFGRLLVAARPDADAMVGQIAHILRQ